MNNQAVLLKKTMTKKKYRSILQKGRSMVAMDMNIGTRAMKSPKEYDRNREKQKMRTERED